METEIILGDVVGKSNNYAACIRRNGEVSIVKNDRIRKYESNFAKQCKVYKDKGIDGRFILHAEVYYSCNAYDLDNSLKTILDCLQYVKAIKNDNLCVGIIANKHIDVRRPRIEFYIEEKEPKFNLFKQ